MAGSLSENQVNLWKSVDGFMDLSCKTRPSRASRAWPGPYKTKTATLLTGVILARNVSLELGRIEPNLAEVAVRVALRLVVEMRR